jgi:hypothetical protein
MAQRVPSMPSMEGRKDGERERERERERDQD